MELFLRLNPGASPLVGDLTLWALDLPGACCAGDDDKASPSPRRVGLRAPGFPASSAGAEVFCECDPTCDELKFAAMEAASRSGSDEDVAAFVERIKGRIKKNRSKDGDGDVASAPSSSPAAIRSMALALGEAGRDLGWARVADARDGALTLSADCDDDGGDQVPCLLSLSIPAEYPSRSPSLISCQLPEPPEWSWRPGESTLRHVYEAFMEKVRAYRPLLSALRELDRCAWVVDPERPTAADLHRTVVIRPGVTLTVTLEAGDARGLELPSGLRLLGPRSAVEPLRRNLVDNAARYRPELSLLQNLERVLEVEFPHRDDASSAAGGGDEDGREAYNVDCCICYSLHLGPSLPDRSCENAVCGRRFHAECLFEYLQSNVENVRAMGVVHGSCPYCDAKISCREPMSMLRADYVVVGGGIAGVSCVQMLAELTADRGGDGGQKEVGDASAASIALITATAAVKRVTNLSAVTERLAAFDVEEVDASELAGSFQSRMTVLRDEVLGVDPGQRTLRLRSGREVRYGRLCLCHGAAPKTLGGDGSKIRSRHVRTIRDVDSVAELQRALAGARRVLVVGNGGIATELVHELSGVEVVWAVRDDHPTAAFVDAGAGQFFLQAIRAAEEKEDGQDGSVTSASAVKRLKYGSSAPSAAAALTSATGGAALGPDWHRDLAVVGGAGGGKSKKRVRVEYECELEAARDLDEMTEDERREALDSFSDPADRSVEPPWRAAAALTNGVRLGCDVVVAAVGVTPGGAGIPCRGIELTADGAIKVNHRMETGVDGVFAAGDVCQVDFGAHSSPLWLQMRLWTQARQMGMYAAQCMLDDSTEPDFCFQAFAHATRFFGFKVVLLGLFNAQGLGTDEYTALVRVTPGREYVKCVMSGGRMKGAVLVGDTDLEETFENLILNQMDLTHLQEHLLDPAVDIEDYFD